MSDSEESDATLDDHDPPAEIEEPEEGADATIDEESGPPAKAPWTLKKKLIIGAKIGISIVGLYLVWRNVLKRDGAEEILGHLETLNYGWFAGALAMQLTAIGFAILRWRDVLGGQGIRAKAKFLFPSFMIGRFFGGFTPGGIGLDGWKLFDVGIQTKKWARPLAVLGVEKILGQLAFGVVVMGASLWGVTFIGEEGVILVNGFFVVLVTVGLTFLARPNIFRVFFRLLPAQVQPKLQTLIDAVCAYHGQWALLTKAFGYGVAVHAFNNLIYVCAARAIGVELDAGMIFFASSLQIMLTLVPISLNGIGLREAAAVALYTSAAVGLSEAQAVLIPTVGFAAEMLVSITGVLFLAARRFGEVTGLEVEDADREEKYFAELPEIAEEKWPSIGRGVVIGLGAGLLGGMIVGVGEGVAVVVDGGGRSGYGVLAYGAVVYGVFCALGGAAFMLASTRLGRWMRREAVPEPSAYARLSALVVAVLALGLGAFRIRRDVFDEAFAFKSKEGLLLLASCLVASAILYFLLSQAIRLWASHKAGSFLLKAWGTPALVAAVVVGLVGFAAVSGTPAAAVGGASGDAPENAPNVLFIVVDTLRADHLPAYGYANGSTPNLDRFAEDAVRYDQAFSNASWTRPSFASILTGRYAASHSVMGKPDALPDDVVTLPEALHDGGYGTAGWVTNFNVNAHYNFQQGFDLFDFLGPENVLWADDAAIKLLLMQVLRRGYETVNARLGRVQPGSIYQDAETVNQNLTGWLDEGAPSDTPWFMFVGYMDPHDPYFPHPYDGSGYARAAHQHPDLEEAEGLRDLYDGEITYWDEHFGRLMDDLRRRGLYDDMMIVVTADHGEEFGEHGGFWHGTTLYDEQVHVPLFVKLPGNERAGTRISHWVQSIDLMPSVLARVGLERPEGVQGGSLEEGTTRVYAEENHEGNILESVRELRDFEELKIITANPGNPRGLEPVELYRVADDRGEETNVAADQQEIVQGLMSSMEEARTIAAEGAVEGAESEMDEDTRCQLCCLGYMTGEVCCSCSCYQGTECN